MFAATWPTCCLSMPLTRDDDLGRRGNGKGDALGGFVDHFVAETKRQLDVLALHGGTIANALDGQLLLEAGRNAGDDVLQQRAGSAPGSAGKPRVIGGGNHQAFGGLLNLDGIHQVDAQLALRALGADGPTIDRDRNAAHRCHRFLAST